ncbi:MAG: ribonuclease P protein component [Puniceicoccales bacterium]|jgi:ribonuclease P protein component|nr:ribonuclease P protein component [Puniceicoccales bacterium]
MYRLFESQRIRRASDFLAFRLPHAVGVRVGLLAVKSIERDGACGVVGPRIGVIIPKKVGNAAKRNRVRRVIRETFRVNMKTFKKDRDYLFIALRGICSKSNGEIANAVVGATLVRRPRENADSGPDFH